MTVRNDSVGWQSVECQCRMALPPGAILAGVRLELRDDGVEGGA
jgi:hypothetical protein